MIILVTGASGQLGTLVVRKLQTKKYKIIGISRKYEKELNFSSPLYTHIKLDIKNKKKLSLEINKINPDVIFHLAAYIPKSKKKSCYNKSYKNNLIATKNILEVCKNLKSLKKIVFTSSISVHPLKNNYPIEYSEKNNPTPDGFYGRHKLKCETELKKWTSISKKTSIVLRLSGLHGKSRKSGVIYNFYKSAVNHKRIFIEKPFFHYSFLFLDDAAEAFINILTLSEIKGFNIYNISGKNIINLKELATKIRMNIRNKKNIKLKVSDNELKNYSTLSILKAKKEISWQPKQFNKRLSEVCKYWSKYDKR